MADTEGTAALPSRPRPPRRVAVVGAGIAGLTAGWLLGSQCEVTLFEKSSNGLAAQTIDLQLPGPGGPSEPVLVDIPFRMHTPTYYPNLCYLCEIAGVPVDLLTGNEVAITGTEGLQLLSYRNFKVFGFNIAVPSLLLSSTAFLMVRDFLWFMWRAPQHLQAHKLDGITIQEYLTRERYSASFADKLLFPFMSAVCTCSYQSLQNFPAEHIVRYFVRAASTHSTFRHFRLGNRDVVAKLSARLHATRYNTAIDRVETDSSGVFIVVDGKREQFDHVIIATQANHASTILDESMESERKLLKQIQHEESVIMVHTDTSLLSERQGEDHRFEIQVSDDYPMPSVHLCLNRVVPSLPSSPLLFETWNPWHLPPADRIVKLVKFERPVLTLATDTVLSQLQELQGRRGVWFCGAYSVPGIPLLENGVVGALQVARALGVDLDAMAWPRAGCARPPPRTPSRMVAWSLGAAAVAAATASVVLHYAVHFLRRQ